MEAKQHEIVEAMPTIVDAASALAQLAERFHIMA
jgi:hypothetical protein